MRELNAEELNMIGGAGAFDDALKRLRDLTDRRREAILESIRRRQASRRRNPLRRRPPLA